jgi:hypothetical protein
VREEVGCSVRWRVRMTFLIDVALCPGVWTAIRRTTVVIRLPLALPAVIERLVAQHIGHPLQLAWGDVPTWLLFAGATVAAIIALRQLGVARDDSIRQTRQLERNQVDGVDITWHPATRVAILASARMQLDRATHAVVVITNDSHRPIHDVISQIRLPGGQLLDPVLFGVTNRQIESSGLECHLFDPRPGGPVQVIRPRYAYGFIFEFTIPDDDAAHPERRTAHPFGRFTDDTDLLWQIDDTLRFKQLPRPRPRPPWLGTLGPQDP